MRKSTSYLKTWRAILLYISHVSKAEGLVTSLVKPEKQNQHSILSMPMTALTESPTIQAKDEAKTALDHFDDMQDGRIDRAEQIPVDLSVFRESSLLVDDETLDRLAMAERKSFLRTGISTENTELPPIVELEYLQELYSGASEVSADAIESAKEGRRLLFQQIQLRGGCCLVKFKSDSKYALVLKDMWSSMEGFFNTTFEAETNAENDGSSGSNEGNSETNKSDVLTSEQPMLMRQHLTRPEQSPDAGGYDFVQTFLDPVTKKVVPTTIQDSLGWDHPVADAVEDSFHALSDLSKIFTTVLSSGGLQRPISEIEAMLNDALLDDFGCCNHRLCQYRPLLGSNTTDATTTESLLRSHTDWSLVTCIPNSAKPGLLTYDPFYQKWLAPDTVVASHQVGSGGVARKNESNYQYCLMMTGKCMDMLLGVEGGIACIHQVVPTPRQQHSQSVAAAEPQQAPAQRLSAPFFLRPKESVSVLINEQCNSKPCSSEESAITMLHKVYSKLGT
ncbi:MAG: hypothetical protein SGBAC_005113 [Bacillariaceae sp.]